MKISSCPYREVRIYFGSLPGEPKITNQNIKDAIGWLQKGKGLDENLPVRVTPTTFVTGDIQEEGWEIAILSFPKLVKIKAQVDAFALNLAERILWSFKPYSVSIVYSDEIVTLELDTYERNPYAANNLP